MATRASRLQEVSLTSLRPNPDQPRKTFDEGALGELAESIDRNGLIQPIVAVENGDGFTIVAGERRYRAVQKLAWKDVPVLVIEDGMTDELALVENVQREDLHPLEEAAAMQGLMERHDYSESDLAGVIGKARTTVINILKLNQLPERVKEECNAHPVSKSLLMEIAQLPSGERLNLWDKVKDGGMTVAQARAIKKRKKRVRRTAAVAAVEAGQAFHKRLRVFAASGEDDADAVEKLRKIVRELSEILDGIGE